MGRPKGTVLRFSFCFIIWLLLSSASYGKEKTFSQDDRERLIRLETILKEFKESIDKRFAQIDKRFEQMELPKKTQAKARGYQENVTVVAATFRLRN